MNVLDLFSGIGAFALGLERAGFNIAAFCEIDDYCRRVLAQRWPGVPIYGDIRYLTADRLARDDIDVDVTCGGWPCQDISIAGRGAGIAGPESGLWREYARLIGELRPRYALMENVAALLDRGMGEVLADLAALGYDTTWHCIPASYMGAAHRRDRVWIVAYPEGERVEGIGTNRLEVARQLVEQGLPLCNRDSEWQVEPDLRRATDGSAHWMDRLRVLGNSLVPQIPEMIGRAIMMEITHGES